MMNNKQIQEVKVRTAESTTSDVYINVNDLIIELMLESEKANSQAEKDYIRNLIARLVKKETIHTRTANETQISKTI